MTDSKRNCYGCGLVSIESCWCDKQGHLLCYDCHKVSQQLATQGLRPDITRESLTEEGAIGSWIKIGYWTTPTGVARAKRGPKEWEYDRFISKAEIRALAKAMGFLS